MDYRALKQRKQKRKIIQDNRQKMKYYGLQSHKIVIQRIQRESNKERVLGTVRGKKKQKSESMGLRE